jgi:hypothetical protein
MKTSKTLSQEALTIAIIDARHVGSWRTLGRGSVNPYAKLSAQQQAETTRITYSPNSLREPDQACRILLRPSVLYDRRLSRLSFAVAMSTVNSTLPETAQLFGKATMLAVGAIVSRMLSGDIALFDANGG